MRRRLSAIRFMLSLMWGSDRALFIGHLLVSIAGVTASLLFAAGIGPLVNGAVRQNASDILVGGVVCGVSLLLLVSLPVAQRAFMTRSIEVLIMTLQARILSMTANAPGLEQFEEPDFWDKLQLLKRHFAEVLQGLLGLFIVPLITAQLIVAAVVLFRVDPLLVVLPLVVLPVLWLHQRATKLEQATEGVISSTRRSVSQIFESASGIEAAKDIRVFGLRHALVNRHRELSDEVLRATDLSRVRSLALNSAGHLLVTVVFAFSLVLVLRQAARGELTAGDVALTLSMAAVLVGAANATAGMSSVVLRAVTLSESHDALIDHISRRAAALATPDSKPVPDTPGTGFRLDEVSFRYPGTRSNALDNVSLDLPTGGVLALVGENGAGKTTLVKILLRMYPPSAGKLLLDDRDVAAMNLGDYRRRVSASFQDFVRFELPVGQSVAIGDIDHPDPDRLRQVLASAECDFVHRLPAGLQTELGTGWEGGVALSGGQWQRLALARAMMRREPHMVIYDEPTAGLDPQAEYAIFRRIADQARLRDDPSTLTLLVSHRFSTVRMADLIVVLNRGSIVQLGSHEELVSQPGLYGELYELQAKSYR